MKKQIVVALTLMIALVCFSSCEKEAIESPSPEKKEFLEPTGIETSLIPPVAQTDSSVSDSNDQLESRSNKTLIYREDVTLGRNQWWLKSLYKIDLNPYYRYTAVVTPYRGNVDLYLYGRQPGSYGATRLIRSSTNPVLQVDQVSATLSLLYNYEDRMMFGVIGQPNVSFTSFIVEIFQEPILMYNTPCKYGC